MSTRAKRSLRRTVLLVFSTTCAAAAGTLAMPISPTAAVAVVAASTATPTWQRDIGRFGAAEVSPVDMQRDPRGDWWVIDEGLACLKKYGPDLTTVKATAFTCGQVGRDANHMGRARGLGLDHRTGEVWVADTPTHRLHKLDTNGNVLLTTTLANAPSGALLSPGDVTVDDAGNAYVVDEKDRIIKVSPSGAVLAQFGGSGSGVGRMHNVMSIEYSAVGGPHLYTTDSRNYQIDKWTMNGTNIASFGGLGTGDGQVTKDARGIAIDSAGTIYVADVGGNRIIRFTKDGVPMSSLGNGLPYNHRLGLDLAYGARGLYVDGNRLALADMWNGRVLFWTLTGADTGARIGGRMPSPDSHLEPRGVARDNSGNVYVSDYWHQWIQKFGPDGTLLAAWGIGRGADPGTLNLPGGIEVDNARGFLYIANREERVVDRWRLSDGAFSARFEMPPGPVDEKGWLRDVAVDEASGRVYAADDRNRQVVIFSSAGAILRIITTCGRIRLGEVRTVDSGPDGLLYVGDSSNRRVCVFSATGDPVRSFAVPEDTNGISVSTAKIYVLSYRVLEYSLTGTLISEWSSTGTRNEQLLAPYGGIVASPTGEVIIADSGSHRVKVFS